MKNLLATRHLCLFLFGIIPMAASSQIITKKIIFPAGKPSTVIKDTVKGRQTIDYEVTAKNGMVMSAIMKTNHTAAYFNVLPPGSKGEAIFIGSTEGNNYSGTTSVAGTYKIRVYMMASAGRRNETAPFSLHIGLK